MNITVEPHQTAIYTKDWEKAHTLLGDLGMGEYTYLKGFKFTIISLKSHDEAQAFYELFKESFTD